ncbi:MAG: uracil-DNA glycosylase family protein [Verrucomicrobiota bacterium]|nr:uracil-DNA glycosylase family protein [Verrucomicrobiota bacterium]
MAPSFEHLLDVTIEHLERLKSAGHSRIQIDPQSMETLHALAREKPSQASVDKVIPASSRLKTPPISSARTAAPIRKVAFSGLPAASQEEEDLIGRVDTWPTLQGAEKDAAMERLMAQATSCVRCTHLAQSRTQVVFGVGSVHAKLMFVGEAPGLDEDRQGEPFVGKAGEMLTRILEAMGLTREAVYIANVLKCRPDTPGNSFGNRQPSPMEMQSCWPYLMDQIKLIRPSVMVALGGTAVRGLLGRKTVGITRLRGQFQDFRGIPVMPTYHPAYVLRNPSKNIKRQVWEDMLQVMEHLKMPISAKQRQFFTK